MRVRRIFAVSVTAVAALIISSGLAAAQDRPNILVLWGDDIGM